MGMSEGTEKKPDSRCSFRRDVHPCNVTGRRKVRRSGDLTSPILVLVCSLLEDWKTVLHLGFDILYFSDSTCTCV